MSKAAAGKRVQLKKEGLGDAPVEPKLATKKKVEEEAPGGWTEPVNIVVKPAEQLDLTEKELATEVTRILSAKDPGAPHNVTRYNFQLQSYKLDASIEQMATHLEMEGNIHYITGRF